MPTSESQESAEVIEGLEKERKKKCKKLFHNWLSDAMSSQGVSNEDGLLGLKGPSRDSDLGSIGTGGWAFQMHISDPKYGPIKGPLRPNSSPS